MEVKVAGRGVTAPETVIGINGEQLRIRIDCALNPEFWLELVANAREFRDMLNRHLDADDVGGGK